MTTQSVQPIELAEDSVGLSEKYAGLSINATRLMSTLDASCSWGNTPDGGMNRLALNDDDKKVRDWFVEETGKYGCHHKIDEMGNIFAIRPGQNNNLAPIGLGSHLDTQPRGGRYDGILGVISAIEVLKVLHQHDITTYAPVAVVNWTNEEGARFPPAMLCSGVWGGAFTADWAHSRVDHAGATLKDELQRIGYLGTVPSSCDVNPLLAHFELHIEQGPILDRAEQPASVVKGVQSMRWYNIQITGREAHTGTTPMESRSDALLGAAKMIVATNKIVTEGAIFERGGRATIAVINSAPQSINTIAGNVQLGLDIRAPADSDVELIESLCRKQFQKISDEHGLKVAIDNFWVSPAVNFDATMVQCVRDSCGSVGCGTIELVSGAGHDSVYTSHKVPTAMIFVRCRDGISHNPAEYSKPEDCAVGAQVLLGAYLRYDDLIRRSTEAKI
ncbi:N-carbamoyl-L-amino acid hydrolase, putative [Talaromyces stipitatus ATCC 10500]|uniref:N-carbamoyl-L-amino acid hydrolase, putative n=1 Tax=Talaromyces stipitatus (strain ATCC 10500 / CBS 375.48 / QM 6759 / NRRL 1006) TaxID=441959 RepID=B8LZW9_TALSN|nr:N-carbamoyl-L-amino acid hydrolase, putative [Talaromyces stipitatus ATCC 10500]EED20901.1 N-carbamoyl-L-amino acid hydrolase, putative [Talaromyces stipitatus ATCC 10500]